MDQTIEQLLNMPPDYRGVFIADELNSLKLYISSLEDYLPHIQDQYELREINKFKNDTQAYNLQQEAEESRRIEQISTFTIPRMFNNSALLMIWACYEASVKDYANFIKIDNKIESVLKYSGFNAINKYYSNDLELSLIDPYFNELSNLYDLRNQIIHSNGFMNSIFDSERNKARKKEREKIRKYIKSTEGIEIQEEVINCSSAFIKKTI